MKKILLGLLLMSTIALGDINTGKRNVDNFLKQKGASFTSYRSQRLWKGFYIYEGVATVRGQNSNFSIVVDPKTYKIIDSEITKR